jgi:DUF971 family protein
MFGNVLPGLLGSGRPLLSQCAATVAGMAEVTGVEVERERAVTLTFDDGMVCRFGLEELRRACPCATCRGRRERGEQVWPVGSRTDPLRITGAELVGSWGISFTWNDGHTDGIYAWELLEGWCRAEPDAAEPDR